MWEDGQGSVYSEMLTTDTLQVGSEEPFEKDDVSCTFHNEHVLLLH